MLKGERLARVARAIEDEMFFQRHGFTAPATDADPTPTTIAIAEAAILAADGDTAALDELRATRHDYAMRLLGLPDAVEKKDDITMSGCVG